MARGALSHGRGGGRLEGRSLRTSRERELLEAFIPEWEAELRRIGVSEADARWIHAGSDRAPTEELLAANLAALRALPTGMGVVAYCAWLGFDHDEAKRELFGA